MPLITILSATGILDKKKIGSLAIDCVVDENITLSTNVTTAPIETGESVTDHAFNEPLKLSVTGIVSDSDPARALQNLSNIVKTAVTNPKDILNTIKNTYKTLPRLEAYETLRQMHIERTPIDVVMGLETYTNMMIENINIARNADSGDALFFTCDLIQVTLLDRVASLTTGGKVNKGRKQGTVASNRAISILSKIRARLPFP
jgi:hypothetical protein